MEEFQRSSPGWVLQQAWQRLTQWAELHLPDWDTTPVEEQGDFSLFGGWLLLLYGMTSVLLLLVCWQVFVVLTRARRIHPQRRTPRRALPHPVSSWVALASAAQAQGNYREACHCLYQALLQQLHDFNIVSQQISRTDREYLHLLSSTPQEPAYRTLLQTHETLSFDPRAVASAEMVDRCQQALETVQNSQEDPR